MIGKHRIIVQNKRVKYDFEVRRNITIIRGDSATGKTSLIEMIREYNELEEDSGVELQCDKNCVALSGINWKIQLEAISDSIVFIDEGNAFVMSKEFATMVQDSDNYYVLVTRQSIPTLPYSVNEIYGIRVSGKYASLKQKYNEFYHIYGKNSFDRQFEPQIVLTEDSNSGK